jgi:hypothetical protein
MTPSGLPDDKPHFPPDDLKVDFGKIMKDAADPKKLAEFRRQEDERRERQMQERAERARQDALASFTVYPGHEITHAWVCPRCASIVASREQHLESHAGSDATAAQASLLRRWLLWIR